MKKTLLLLVLVTYKAFAQTLPVNAAGEYLDKNQVKTRISSPNYKFWNVYGNQNASYAVPVSGGVSAMSANSIWIGGLDNNNKLHMSANTYRQNSGNDWWGGPLDTTNLSAFNYSNSLVYNRLWKVDCHDIDSFATAYSNGFISAGTYSVPDNILNYPAYGIGNFQKKMESFYDANNDGLYRPQQDGDYPLIRGQQQVLSIFNDSYSHHMETGGAPMGLEVHEYSYAYSEPAIADSMKSINYTTFYHYTIYNRSDTDYYHVYMTDWADIDLGYFGNDFIGTDTVNEFAYCYNYGANDPNSFAGPGYGTRLPVVSLAMLKTDCLQDGIDNDNDGLIDEPGEQFHLDKSTFYSNNIGTTPGPVSSPTAVINPANGHPDQYYGYMSGFWLDGMPFTYGGCAYGGTLATSFVYPGDPYNNSGWTEGSAGDSAGDRRILVSSHLFHFPKKSKIEWGFAVVFSQDTTQHTNTISQFHSRVQRDVRNARYYESQHQAAQCTPAIYSTVGIKENKMETLSASVYPNPASNVVTVVLNDNVISAVVNVTDLSGRIVAGTTINGSYRGNLDLSALEKGIYLVEIRSGDKKATQKIIRN